MKKPAVEYRQHYHMIYSKKLPHGVVKVDINLLAPRGEIAEAFAEVDRILKEDLQNHTSET